MAITATNPDTGERIIWRDGQWSSYKPITATNLDTGERIQFDDESEDWVSLSSSRKEPVPDTASSDDRSALTRTFDDFIISGAKGISSVARAGVGLLDIPTGGRVGKFLEDYAGYDPEEIDAAFERGYSSEQQEANQRVAEAEGFTGTVGAMIKNPSTIAHSVAESIPSMLGGAKIAQGITKVAPKVAPVIAFGAGEGAVAGGGVAEDIRQQQEDRLLSVGGSVKAAGSAIGTGIFGVVGARITKKLGLTDIDELLATGKSGVTEAGIVKRIVGGGISEGAFEELPQSVQEQMWLNAATDKPLFTGTGEAAASGLVVGGVTGAGTNLPSRGPEIETPDKNTILASLRKDLKDPAAGLDEDSLRRLAPNLKSDYGIDEAEIDAIIAGVQNEAAAEQQKEQEITGKVEPGDNKDEALKAFQDNLKAKIQANATPALPQQIPALPPGQGFELSGASYEGSDVSKLKRGRNQQVLNKVDIDAENELDVDLQEIAEQKAQLQEAQKPKDLFPQQTPDEQAKIEQDIKDQRSGEAKKRITALASIWDSLSEQERDAAAKLIVPQDDSAIEAERIKKESMRSSFDKEKSIEADRKAKEALRYGDANDQSVTNDTVKKDVPVRDWLGKRPDLKDDSPSQKIDYSDMKESGRWTEPDLPDSGPATDTVPPPAPSVSEAATDQKQVHDFSSTQVDLPKDQAESIKSLSKKIPDNEIYNEPGDDSYGREDKPHITVRYGLGTADPKDIAPAFKEVGPIRAKFGKVSIFEADKYDVVKVDIESPDLVKANKRIGETVGLPGETFKDYKPHATIAYVKKGEGQKYIGDKSVEGQEVSFDSITLSAKDGSLHKIPLDRRSPPVDPGGAPDVRQAPPVKNGFTQPERRNNQEGLRETPKASSPKPEIAPEADKNTKPLKIGAYVRYKGRKYELTEMDTEDGVALIYRDGKGEDFADISDLSPWESNKKKAKAAGKRVHIGDAWVGNQWKPIIDKREILKGKNKGKLSVTLPDGSTKTVAADAIKPIEPKSSPTPIKPDKKAAKMVDGITSEFTKILKDEKGSAPIINDMAEAAFNLYRKGSNNLVSFSKGMRERFKDSWGTIKHHIQALYQSVRKFLKDERGHLTVDFRSSKKIKSQKKNKPVVSYQETKGPVTDQDYIKNRKLAAGAKIKASEHLSVTVNEITEGVDRYLGPISTRLANINPKLRAKLRKLEFDIGTKHAEDVKAVKSMLDKAKKRMTGNDFADWDYARKNSDTDKIWYLAQKYGLRKDYQKYRETLDKLRDEAKAVGLDIGQIVEYAPRILKNKKGFLKALQKGKDWPVYSKALKEKAADMGMTVDQLDQDTKADIVSNIVLGGVRGMGGPAGTKSRKLTKIPPELNRYYMNSDAALVTHLHSMRTFIEGRKFFGKIPTRITEMKKRRKIAQRKMKELDSNLRGEITGAQRRILGKYQAVLKRKHLTADEQKGLENKIAKIEGVVGTLPDRAIKDIRKKKHRYGELVKIYSAEIEKYANQRDFRENIGSYIIELLDSKQIKEDQESTVQEILDARFHQRGARGIVQAYKNLAYIDTMGSPISALTQIGDLAWSAYEGGVFNTVKFASKAFIKRSRITKEDVGIERMAQEFADPGTLSKALNKIFKMTGLEHMDSIGKEALLNSALVKYQKMAKKKPGKLKRKIKHIFEGETDSVVQDLLNDNITENVKLLVYSRLLDFQPVALSEMPQKYLTAGNGRVFYMLKTFTIKQFDIFRNEVYNKIREGTYESVKEGLTNFARLSMLFVLANAGADELKDFILRREVSLSDKVWDNLLRLAGASKYIIWQARREGLGTATKKQILPPTQFIDSVYKDVVSDEETPRVIKSLPIVGKIAYWHMRANE